MLTRESVAQVVPIDSATMYLSQGCDLVSFSLVSLVYLILIVASELQEKTGQKQYAN